MANVTVQKLSPAVETPAVSFGQNNGKLALTQKNGHSHTQASKVEYSLIHNIPGRMRFRIPRLRHDPAYAQRLQMLLEADNLVTHVRIKPAASSVTVTYKVSGITREKIKSHLIYVIQAANEVIILKPSQLKVTDAEKPWTVPLSAVATTLAVLSGPLGLSVPPLIIVGTIALATLPVMQRAWEGITQEKKLNIDFLDFAAIVITTFQGQFLTPALMLGLIEVGENIRDRTARSSAQQTLDLLSSLGQFAWVERDGCKQQISIEEVRRGDKVIVYPGEQVPVDGTIIQGEASLDEQKLTGESMPVLKTKGQIVYASTLVREGQIYITAERLGNDTCAGQSIQLMQQAPVHDTRMENYAAKIAQKAVLPTLLLGGAVFAATRNPARAASVLTLDFATGIRVSVPTTVLAALTYGARRGILIRSGRALEKLAEIDTIVFDKTGTLTKGEAAVIDVESFREETSTLRVLQLAAACEQRLTHPVAEAIIRYAEAQKIEIPSRSQWDYQLGLGVEAEIEGQTVYVGSTRFLQRQGVEMTAIDKTVSGTSAIYVASDGQLQGRIVYNDVLRPESREIITALLTVEGVEVHMLTGDNKRTAAAVAAQLGIPPSHTHAEAFPEQKATVVRELHKQGKTVAFVGDGINDSPALAYADVSVSFANGSDIARETADVVLMHNDLHGLLEGISLARKAKQLIQQNTSIIAVPNLGALVVAVLFGLNPLAATLVNNGSTVVAGVNGLRPMFKSTTEKILPSAR